MATPDDGATAGTVDCAAVLNMPLVQRSARERLDRDGYWKQ